jgi:hypothetical protein
VNALSKLLVVDATVVHAAGGSVHPHSSATRSFLNSVLEICHRVVLTAELGDEWKRHQSKVTRRWRVAMYARRKIVKIQVPQDVGLRTRVTKDRAKEEITAILKDIHLVEAALGTEKIVVSMDEKARAFFAIPELRFITWVNPVSDPARVHDWLQQGAPPVEEWKLGYRA